MKSTFLLTVQVYSEEKNEKLFVASSVLCDSDIIYDNKLYNVWVQVSKRIEVKYDWQEKLFWGWFMRNLFAGCWAVFKVWPKGISTKNK